MHASSQASELSWKVKSLLGKDAPKLGPGKLTIPELSSIGFGRGGSPNGDVNLAPKFCADGLGGGGNDGLGREKLADFGGGGSGRESLSKLKAGADERGENIPDAEVDGMARGIGGRCGGNGKSEAGEETGSSMPSRMEVLTDGVS